MTFEQFYSNITSSMEQYNSAGLIDSLSVYDWMLDAMNEIAIVPTIRIEALIKIKNNRGSLPDGFKSLYSAVKCEPYVCTINDEKPRDVLLDIYQYKVREIKKEEWDICNPCDIKESDSCVVEKVFLHNGTRANFYYNNLSPLKLKLTTYVRRNRCDVNCPNLNIQSAPYEISINNKVLHTNFKDGNIFVVYNGYDEDEDGFVMIPETDENNLEKYITSYVKKEIIRKMLENSDNTTNEQFLFTLYSQELEKYKAQAKGEYKLKKVLGSMKDYSRKIKREFEVYNFGSFSHNQTNRIEFLVT